MELKEQKWQDQLSHSSKTETLILTKRERKFWKTSNIIEKFCFVISKHISVGLINILDNAILGLFTLVFR